MIKLIIKIVLAVGIGVMLVLSFFKFFPSYEIGQCSGEDRTVVDDGVVLCRNQANFWEYVVDFMELTND